MRHGARLASVIASALALTLLLTLRPAQARTVGVAGDPLIPVHGIVIAPFPRHRALVRLNAVPEMLPGGSRVVALGPGTTVASGEEIDAFLAGPPSRLHLSNVVAAPPFVPGSLNPVVKRELSAGDALPDYTLLDQRRRPYHLGAVHGKVTLLTFIFSRCPDRTLCPAISGKFLYLQQHLDPAHFHLIEITLDPPYDSPAVLARYGAMFGADPARWSLLTGRASDVKDVMDGFGLSELASGRANYIHDDRLAIVGPDGRIRTIVETAGWNPDDAIAEARAAQGEDASTWRRIELNTIANVIAFCGGSTNTALITLSCGAVAIILAISGYGLVWFGRRIFAKE